ncbi:hypothetical protein QBC46DRAFT_460363 [Diplogelasinospora grovesii]|uniref:Uncharacterized protein n=1 Tax=Diplogelasinospora grovesii TaxID=303347 RepID=A0AAN6N5N1_9PEZI|nr:hypothetical protein QBC46DRAFT_460363 [Diplogelasinospora grovesii]
MAMAESDERFFIFENRLASFQGPQPVAKSRTQKALHWPHKSLSPVELAKAGFVFEPHPASPDNVFCFLCNKALDGWEANDNPLEEHVKHSPSCGWAIMAAIEAEMGDFGKVHPLEPSMIEARKATFGGRWPYESKKGFKCKTKQLAEAGWIYTPTLEADDMATCAYCQLALDGWEAGDKPMQRSPDCPFFVLVSQNPPPKKMGRTKAVGASKASRLSVQSVATVATAISDLGSTADITADHDDSVMTTTSVMTQGGRKTAKGRKAPATKARKTRAKQADAVEILEDEPEAPVPPPKPARGRKRASDAMEDSAITNAEAPAPKKRAARTRASNTTTADTSIMTTATQETDMPDAAPVKPAAGRKKAAAKTTRKASQSSSLKPKASIASLRANLPEDEEIDRQLQADLERPLTDDEDLAADSESEKKKGPASAKGRAKKPTTTRKASAQNKKVQNEDHAMFDPTLAEPDEAVIEAELKALELEVEAEEQMEVERQIETETLAVPKKGRKAAGTRKVSKQTKKAKPPVPPSDPVDEPMEEAEPEPEPVQEPVQPEEPEPEPMDDADTSSGTVVNKTAARTSTGKRGRGRPPKRSSALQSADEELEERRSSAESVQVKVQFESGTRESLRKTPARVSTQPAPVEEESTTPTGPTPARTDKALPPPPPQSETPRPPPTTPRAHRITPSALAKQTAISPSQSLQSSDAENQPPSSKPSSKPTASAMPKRVVLAPVAATPRNVVAGLQSTTPWTVVDIDMVFSSPSKSEADKQNGVDRLLRKGTELTSPEKRMTVEEWIYHNAGLAEQKLKHECEVMVTTFEKEGTRAMNVLEGLIAE